ncbi:MAG: prolipoprotein diacylglyceryl transferase [Oscillospiraceae bacterium]
MDFLDFHVQFPGLGLNFTINRVAFSIFGMDIYWYGIILATAMLVSFAVYMKLAKRKGIDGDKLIDVIMVGAVCAIICARIYYVVFAPFKYNSLWDMINIRDGGIAIYGAVIGAFVFGGLACKWKKLDVLEVFDITATCFLLGQGIGRWGNFVNQEAFGTNTTLPWGMFSEGTQGYLQAVQARLAQQGVIVDPTMPVHPTFLYESLWCILGFVILYAYFNHKKFKGEMLCMYLVWYGTGRYFIESLRTDSLETNGGIRTSQLVAIVTVVASVALILYMRNRAKKVPVSVISAESLSGEDLKTADCIAKAIEKNEIKAKEIEGEQESDALQQEEPPQDVSR